MVDIGAGRYLHEPPSRRFPVYTRGNAGEVWPEVAYPLTLSYWRANDAELMQSVLATGIVRSQDMAEGITAGGGCFGGYMYLNLSLSRVVALRSPGVEIEAVDATYLGSEDLAPPHVPQSDDRNFAASLCALRYGLQILGTQDLSDLEADRALVQAYVQRLPSLLNGTDAELAELLRSLHRQVTRLFSRHIDVTSRAGGAIQLLGGLCEDKLGSRDRALDLLTGLGDVDSAAPSTALWNLARLADSSVVVSREFDHGIDGLLTRLRGEVLAAPFLDEFAVFLERYGSRGPNEWETACDTWGTRPELALTLVDRMRGAPDSQEPSARTAALIAGRAERVAEARRLMGFGRTMMFDRSLAAASALSVGRERSKTTVVELIHVVRLIARELAGRVSSRVPGGVWEDMWFCFDDELDDWIADPSSMVETIAQRRSARQMLAARVPPFVFDGEMPPFSTWPLRNAVSQDRDMLGVGDSIGGIAAVPGIAEGRACVVTDPFDPRDLGPGDVLIAPLTDPAWTPLFVPVEAVVVDVGGQMSHAVIVAREFGMPCVVAATDATTRIRHGDQVRVDGTTGTVTIID